MKKVFARLVVVVVLLALLSVAISSTPDVEADGLCPVGTPTIIYPTNSSTNVPVTTILDWDCSNASIYQVYFDTNSTAPGWIGNTSSNYWNNLSTLSSNTKYYWKIVAWDACGANNSSAIWNFTTECLNPSMPGNELPHNTSTEVTIDADLDWGNCSDATYYQVYFDINSSPVNLIGSPNASNLSLPALNSSTTYYWKIVAKNGCGGSTNGSIWSFTTRCANLSTPASPSPNDASTNVSVNADLDWGNCSNATFYQVYFDTDSSPSTLIGSPNDSSLALSPLASSTTYYWKVVARNSCGDATNGSIWSFTTECANLSTPAYTSPANASTGVSVNVDLDWENCAGASYYQVYFSTSPSPSTLVGSPNVSIWTLSNLSSNTKYYWKIVARDSCGGNASGLIWNFTTGCGTPGTPGTPLPANASTSISTDTDLDWGDSSYATYYQVYFDTNSSPSTLVGSPNASSWTLPALSVNATYYWKVVANSCGGSTNGSIWKFTTGGCAAPGTPGSPSPANSSTGVSVDANLDWGNSSDATYYQVYFGTNASLLTLNGSPNASSLTLSTLSINTTYYWKVIAKNGCGGSTNGSIWNFTTGCVIPAKPQTPSPINGSTNISTNIMLDWADCTDTTSYDVYFNTSSTPSYYASTNNSSYQLSQLNYSTKFYWKVVARNSCGLNNSSDIWNLTTVGAPAPTPTISFNIGGTNASWNTSSAGVIQQVVNVTSADETINLYIPAETIALNNQSQPLDELNMSSIDEYPDPSGNRSVVAAFDFDPDGATFDPGIVVTLSYTHDMIPEGVNESSLVIAFYDESLDSWQYINGAVDPDANTITFTVHHFTVFTIQTPSIPHIVPDSSESAGLAKWVIILLVFVAAIILGLVGGLYIKYKRIYGFLSYEDEGDEDDKYSEYSEDEGDFKF